MRWEKILNLKLQDVAQDVTWQDYYFYCSSISFSCLKITIITKYVHSTEVR
jgi:hypothetical protein